MAGSRGSPDSVRDVRGFAVRFYTDEGNFGEFTELCTSSVMYSSAKVSRYCWKQHPGLLHPGRHQVPGSDPRRQAKTGQ